MFFFQITYFKPSGKYYTGTVVAWAIEPVRENSSQAYYHDAVAKVRGLRDAGGPGALPGLSGDGWEGPILVEQAVPRPDRTPTAYPNGEYCCDDFHVDGVPHLILPDYRELQAKYEDKNRER